MSLNISAVDPKTDEHVDFDDWAEWLGNAGMIYRMKAVIEKESALFPTICAKVIHSGSHCCDRVESRKDIEAIKNEAILLTQARGLFPDCEERTIADIEELSKKLVAICNFALINGYVLEF